MLLLIKTFKASYCPIVSESNPAIINIKALNIRTGKVAASVEYLVLLVHGLASYLVNYPASSNLYSNTHTVKSDFFLSSFHILLHSSFGTF